MNRRLTSIIISVSITGIGNTTYTCVSTFVYDRMAWIFTVFTPSALGENKLRLSCEVCRKHFFAPKRDTHVIVIKICAKKKNDLPGARLFNTISLCIDRSPENCSVYNRTSADRKLNENRASAPKSVQLIVMKSVRKPRVCRSDGICYSRRVSVTRVKTLCTYVHCRGGFKVTSAQGTALLPNSIRPQVNEQDRFFFFVVTLDL